MGFVIYLFRSNRIKFTMSKQTYIRDRRSPIPLNEGTSKSMSSNKGKDTKPELILRKALRDNHMSGYRIKWKIPGKPDIAYPGRHIAIFVNGCFWHRCPHCALPLPKNNAEFWRKKFENNVERDRKNTMTLESEGWAVITIWECEIKADLPKVVHEISKQYDANKST